MMFSQAQGNRERREIRGVNNSAEVLLESPASRWTLDSVLFANTSASSVNITLEIYDGANSTALLPAKALAAHDVYLFKDHNILIKPGETLRTLASTADVIDVTATAFYGNTTG